MARSATSFGWHAPQLLASLALFLLAGLLEIVGGWLVWRAMLGGEDAAAIGNSSTPTSSSSWRGFRTPPRAFPARPEASRGGKQGGKQGGGRAAEASSLWLLVPGLAFLTLYGFVPVLQTLVAPRRRSEGGGGGARGEEEAKSDALFGRTLAAYGGFFIVLSYLWGWLADGNRPDRGDCVGAGVAIVGVLVAWFWPRGGGG